MFVRISGVTALFLIGTGPVLAQQAGRIEMDGYDLIPEFSTEMLYIDNVTYAADDNPRISSWVNVISPQITAVTKFSNNSIEAGYFQSLSCVSLKRSVFTKDAAAISLAYK